MIFKIGKEVLLEFIESIKILWVKITIKDPCKKCFVLPCCTKLCSDKARYCRHFNPGFFGNVILERIFAGFCFIGLFVASFALGTYLVVKFFNNG
ncbi:MAG: hypothetical protein ACFFG0_24460 [Candidatus Thorarchaeota archaeon]